MLNYVHHCLIEEQQRYDASQDSDTGINRSRFKRKGSEVYEIYFENKHYLKSLRKLHRLLKREGVTIDRIEWFVNMVKIGAYKIPASKAVCKAKRRTKRY
jgi:hypothetical protein